jgi:uncharacterized protein YeaO (DUF488 family)
MEKIDLILKTGRITARNLTSYAANGYIPIFICRFMNPLVKVYEGTMLHFPNLAPSPGLLWGFKNGNITWDEYKSRYTEEMSKVDLASELGKIYEIVKLNPAVKAQGAVLLCYCQDNNQCHRSLLANMINSSEILNDKIVELYV